MKTTLQRWRTDFRVVLFYLKKYKRYYLFGVLSLLVVDGLEAVPPLLLLSAVDALTEMKFGPELNYHLLKISVAYMAIAVVQGFMRFLWRRYIIRTSMYSSHDMRDDLFVHLSSLAPGFFKKRRVGDLVSLSTNDIEAVRFALGPGALTLCDALFYLIAIPPIMLWISPKLTLIAFIPLLIIPVFARRMEKEIERHFRTVQDKFSTLAAQCQESLGGVRLIKGAAIEPIKEREFARLGDDYVKANLDSARVQAVLTVGLESVISLSTSILFLLGGAYVLQEKISIGVFVAFQRYIQKLSWPMEGLGLAANIFQKALASQKRVDEVLLVQSKILSPPNPKRLTRGKVPDVEARSLRFSFPDSNRAVLDDVSFTMRAGSRLGITGPIGSGKSTLLACLGSLEETPRGAIFFDGIDARDLALEEIRGKIAFVPQESFLFSDSIEENILYGSKENDDLPADHRYTAARHAAELASLHGDVERLRDGYRTLLGERGLNLSGGQRQRLTVARAIARKPDILVLDDCLSAIDAETERNLLNGILKASEGISLIMATHRVSSFQHFDWVILLQNGRIAAQGKPSDLLTSHPYFLELKAKEETMNRNLFT